MRILVLVLMSLSFLNLSMASESKSQIFAGTIKIIATEVKHRAAFAEKDFLGQEVKITLKIDPTNSKNPVELVKLEDKTKLKGTDWTYGPIFDSLMECLTDEPLDCEGSSYVELEPQGVTADRSVAMSFGTHRDEYSQYLTLAGLRRLPHKKTKEIIVGSGVVHDMKYDSGTYIHSVSFSLVEQ